MFICMCDFLVILLLPTGEKRATLTDGIEIQFTRKFIIVSCYNHSPFIYSFSQITCVIPRVSIDLKNARIQEVTCSQINTKFIYALIEKCGNCHHQSLLKKISHIVLYIFTPFRRSNISGN